MPEESKEPARVFGSCLIDLVRARARATPSQLFALDERGVSLDYADLARMSEEMAAGLIKWGIGRGAVVAWQLPTWIEAMILSVALSRLGAIQVPLIPSYRAREVGFILDQSRAQFYIAPQTWGGFDFETMFAELANPQVKGHLLDAKRRDFPFAPAAGLYPFPAPEGVDDARWLYYSSGTTGSPKGARHSDATLLGTLNTMFEMLEPGLGDRSSLVFPFAHIGGLVWLLAGLAAGSTHLVVERFDPSTTIPFLAANRATLIGTGTPFNLAYLEAQRELAKTNPGKRLFPEVRCFMSGATPKPPHLHSAMRDECGGIGIVSSYGMTEAPMLTAVGPKGPQAKLATTEGRAAGGASLAILDAAGHVLDPGVIGEIVAKGPQICRGYVDPDLGGVMSEDGWLHTGDLGFLDAEGYLTVTGRLKDIIIRNGENIAAKEIEDLLFALDKVKDVSVVGLAHPKTGEQVCAVLVCDQDADPLTFEEMVEYLRGRDLMIQKIPERLEIVDALPRNAAGKVRKVDLQARFGSEAP